MTSSLHSERIGSWDLSQPMAITPTGLALIRDVRAGRAVFGGPPAMTLGDGAVTRDGVAVLNIKGPLFRYKSIFSDLFDAASYGQLRKDLARALDDPNVVAILWEVDSPGGEVSGVAELAQAIYEARGKKPSAAYISGAGASAAYWLASAVGKVFCSTRSAVGSIGVLATLTDDTGAQKEAGIRRLDLVSSQSPAKNQDAGDPEYRARVQRQVDALAAVFIANVAKFRGVRPDTVMTKYGAGDVFVGKAALAAGLVDGISDTETCIRDLANQARSFIPTRLIAAAKASPMTAQQKFTKLAAKRKLDPNASATVLVLAAEFGTQANVESILAGKKAKKVAAKLAKKGAKAKRTDPRDDPRPGFEVPAKEQLKPMPSKGSAKAPSAKRTAICAALGISVTSSKEERDAALVSMARLAGMTADRMRLVISAQSVDQIKLAR